MPALMRPINPEWPFATFANGLRALKKASRLTYRMMAIKTHYSRSVLCAAAGGRELPTLEVTLAYVQVCGGAVTEWQELWDAADLARRQREGGARGHV